MAIRQHVQWLHYKKRFSGFVNFASVLDENEPLPIATDAIVILLNGLNVIIKINHSNIVLLYHIAYCWGKGNFNCKFNENTHRNWYSYCQFYVWWPIFKHCCIRNSWCFLREERCETIFCQSYQREKNLYNIRPSTHDKIGELLFSGRKSSVRCSKQENWMEIYRKTIRAVICTLHVRALEVKELLFILKNISIFFVWRAALLSRVHARGVCK